MNEFYSNGKILLTSEYVVLDGVECIALPTKFGQSLSVKQNNSKELNWISYDYKNNVWFKEKYIINSKNVIHYLGKKNNISDTLLKIFKSIHRLNSSVFQVNLGYDFISKLSFSKNWGLGTSSTLINNLANWAKVDSYKLLELTFGGSGYDIACAKSNQPIQFINLDNKIKFKKSKFNPIFKENIFFIYLEEKQNSRDGIKTYRSKKNKLTKEIKDQLKLINQTILTTNNLKEFEQCVTKHELLISKIIGFDTLKNKLFKDYDKGVVKSLGAWGGDFALVTGSKLDMNYFLKKGYKTIFNYSQLIK
ncbi:GYDIA family GHMP kinase [Flavobacteriaceae bacterium]|nr:GYDIA family GHMP kinase [Flavobacteriaceae bacterium]